MATEKVKVFEEGAKKAPPAWLWWLIPLIVLIGLFAWLLSRRHEEPATTQAPVADATKPDAGPGTKTVKTWTAATIASSINQNGHVSFTDTDVHFATASANLAGDSQAVLDQTAQALKDNSSWHMRVVGHTDSIGSDSSNAQLAQNRAESVKTYLVGHGVDGSRLDTESRGAAEPATTNSTDNGRAENRRVELFKE